MFDWQGKNGTLTDGAIRRMESLAESRMNGLTAGLNVAMRPQDYRGGLFFSAVRGSNGVNDRQIDGFAAESGVSWPEQKTYWELSCRHAVWIR